MVGSDTELHAIVACTDSSVTVDVVGELDQGTADSLQECLVDAWHSHRCAIHLRLDRATFFSGATLGAVMTARRLVTSEGGDLIIVAASPVVRRMLEITSTTPLLA